MKIRNFCAALCLSAILVSVDSNLYALNMASPNVDVNTLNQMVNGINKAIDYKTEVAIVGHKNPDCDSVCSAIAYANLKRYLGIRAKAFVSGKINNETKFALKYFEVPTPEVMTDATDKTVILVDHNAYNQAVGGMKEANIVEILDHHGLGDIKTDSPILVRTAPVGSTATIVFEMYLQNGIKVSKRMAGLLVSAILSDTKNLTSVTTTDADKVALTSLVKSAEIKDLDSYYSKLYEASTSYAGMTDLEIYHSDFREFDMNGHRISVAIVYADNENSQKDYLKKMKAIMDKNYLEMVYEHRYTVVIDRKNHKSELIYSGLNVSNIVEKAFEKGMYGRIIFDREISRKRDIIPNLANAYK